MSKAAAYSRRTKNDLFVFQWLWQYHGTHKVKPYHNSDLPYKQTENYQQAPNDTAYKR